MCRFHSGPERWRGWVSSGTGKLGSLPQVPANRHGNKVFLRQAPVPRIIRFTRPPPLPLAYMGQRIMQFILPATKNGTSLPTLWRSVQPQPPPAIHSCSSPLESSLDTSPLRTAHVPCCHSPSASPHCPPSPQDSGSRRGVKPRDAATSPCHTAVAGGWPLSSAAGAFTSSRLRQSADSHQRAVGRGARADPGRTGAVTH